MTVVAIMQPSYWSRLHVWNRIMRADVFVWLDDVPFSRDTRKWDDRTLIVGRTGQETVLRLPREHTGEQLEWRRVRLADDRWRQKHLTSIEHAYRRAPHYDELEWSLEQVYGREHRTVESVCRESLIMAWMLLEPDTRLMVASSIPHGGGDRSERLVEIVKWVGGDAFLMGHGTGSYVDRALFAEHGIELQTQQWRAPYSARGTTSNPSILDLIAWRGATDARSAVE